MPKIQFFCSAIDSNAKNIGKWISTNQLECRTQVQADSAQPLEEVGFSPRHTPEPKLPAFEFIEPDGIVPPHHSIRIGNWVAVGVASRKP